MGNEEDKGEEPGRGIFKYVITGDGMMALAVHSELNYNEFVELIRSQTKKIHPKGRDTIYRWGVIEFINPKVMIASDFVDYLPALIGMVP